MSIDQKRQVFSWCLLLAFCLQRVIGMLGGEVMHVMAIELGMDEMEQTIAASIEEQTGSTFHVEVLSEERLEFVQKLGYSTPFILSEEIDGETQYFTLKDAPETTVKYTSTTKSDQTDDTAPNQKARTFKDRYFSDFFFYSFNLSCIDHLTKTVAGMSFPDHWEAPIMNVPSPPPKRA